MDNNINIVISAKNMAQKAFNDATKSLKSFSASAMQSSQDFAKAFALGGVVTGGLTTIIGKYGSEIQNINNRLLAVSGSQEKANEQFERNLEIAKRARTDIDTVNNVFARFELVQKRMGGTTQETEQMVENLSKGLQVFGASTSEVNSVMLQFSQAMGSGRLQGDEFRSISENFPPLLDELAKVTGVSTSKLKEFASEGGITSEVMKKALLGMTDKLNDQFSKMPITIGQAMTNVKNIFIDSLKKIDEGTGIFTKISGAIATVGLWLEKITPSVVNFVNSLDASQISIIAGIIIGALVPAFVALGGSIVVAMAPLIPFMALGASIAANWDLVATSVERAGVFFESQEKTITFVLESISDAFASAWGFIQSEVVPIIREIFFTIGAVADFSFSVIKNILEGIKITWESNFLWIKDFTFLFFESIKEVFVLYWEVFSGLFKTGMALLRGDWSAAWGYMKDMFFSIMDSVGKIANLFWETIKSIFGSGITVISEAWTAFSSFLFDFFQSTFVDPIQDAIQSVVDFFQEQVDRIMGIVNSVKSGISTVTSAVGGAAKSAGNYISGKRENGGSVSAGSSYLVGEAGPEIFSPSSSGTIIPNDKIGGGGSNITINITGGVFSNASDFADFVSRKIAKNLSSSYA